MSNTTSTCKHCGKPLKIQTCFACGGTGYSHELTLAKRECEFCRGGGRVWRCEDELKHILSSSQFKPFQPNLPKSIVHTPPSTPIQLNVKPKQPTPPQIPPPWHPSYPSPWHPMHPRNPWNPNNLNSPFNRNNPMNPNSPLNINNPQNINSPRHPLNRNNPTNRNAFKK